MYARGELFKLKSDDVYDTLQQLLSFDFGTSACGRVDIVFFWGGWEIIF